MTPFNLALLIFIVLLIPLSRWVRARWVPILIASLFFALMALEIMLGLGVPTRAYVVGELEAGRMMQPVPKVVRDIAKAQSSAHTRILILGLGLLVTVCCWSRSRER